MIGIWEIITGYAIGAKECHAWRAAGIITVAAWDTSGAGDICPHAASGGVMLAVAFGAGDSAAQPAAGSDAVAAADTSGADDICAQRRRGMLAKIVSATSGENVCHPHAGGSGAVTVAAMSGAGEMDAYKSAGVPAVCAEAGTAVRDAQSAQGMVTVAVTVGAWDCSAHRSAGIFTTSSVTRNGGSSIPLNSARA